MLAVAITLAGPSAPAARAAQPSDRPNFVFILIDDLRYDAMSCMNHPFVRTPQIDRLAGQGVRFSNAFVTLSLCAPSRAAILTGAYAHVNGVRTNEQQAFDPAVTPTFALRLQQAGYETGFVGKWHMKGAEQPQPGFDYWLSFRGQGTYIDPQLNENGRTFKAQGYMTDLLTDYALAFLRRPRSKPFALCLWHKAVHGPFTPAPRHQDLYRDAVLPEPPSYRDTLEGKPAWQQRPNRGQARRDRQARRAATTGPAATMPAVPGENLPWEGSAPHRLNYFRTLAAVDESVGRILDALRDAGQLDNTYVIFMSDNGYFHGEHRRGDKRAAYEESIRIPLLIRGPGIARPGSVIDEMVLNIDLAPTLLDLAGLTPPGTMQGRSLRPLLTGAAPDPPWRTAFLYEYFQERVLNVVPTMVGVRTTDWKYITYPDLDGAEELYDLRRDPYEMRNLAGDPAAAATLAEMKVRLAQLKKETGYQDPKGGHR